MVEDNYQGMAMFREGGLKINEIAQRVQEHKDENPDAVDDCFACLYESPYTQQISVIIVECYGCQKTSKKNMVYGSKISMIF